MRKFEDLRFSIGVFFMLVGVLLLIAGVSLDSGAGNAELNFETGSALIFFAALALLAVYFRPMKE